MNRPEIFDRVRDAFDRGRWVMMTDSDGAPQEITIDLKERPDDLLSADEDKSYFGGARGVALEPAKTGTYKVGHDDHGPAVPAQGDLTRSAEVVGADGPFVVREPGPVVYEFALQDAAYTGPNPTLADIVTGNAPSLARFAAADWVHVYDSVTRERRTLKRPPADAVLTGLADVAADLRGQSPAQPAPGPLTSTDGLLPGDMLRVVEPYSELASGLCRYNGANDGSGGRYECIGVGPDRGAQHMVRRFAFVGRPDADGWMDWPGGENPVGEAFVEIWFEDWEAPSSGSCKASLMRWTKSGSCDVGRFRLVDMPPLTGDA